MEITFLVVSVSLIGITIVAVLVQFRRTKKVAKEYAEAKTVLGHIVLSFKRDIQQQEERIRSVSGKIEDAGLNVNVSKDIEVLKDGVESLRREIEEISETSRDFCVAVLELQKKVEDLTGRQRENLQKISGLERVVDQISAGSDRIGAAIPITKDRALARLTKTELTVLEILVHHGGSTASQIQGQIRLTREHTARLMKSLHARGYVERMTERMPYVYRLNDEMMKILKGATSA